ncbi:uncharacterized protein C8Q71DRAFT_699321 [Rhodofomes roseus]|uniref:Uncharacterized protein n=1 Tax=Rhodofomes roseus TaxID=34475 RepID=A0ABQ8KVQ2_9APHY|nr:uncharacterized protein C8Q71DRAFT_699321 [Rhodofomes roseus]KAH9843074.1 hypothetical protein C8Q71DRAFT_699321 [Rhodofomes roseus]
MYIDGYSAWITVPGPEHELREFDVAVDEYNRKSTCWIPSIEGMRFSVHWMDHGHRIATATFIKLDGYTVPGHFLMGSGEAERSDIRVGITTVRPFQFQKVPEGAIPKDTDPTELGTIIVKIKRVSIVGKQGKNAPLVPRPPIGGKRSIGAEDPVGIGYGNEEMGHVQMPMTWKVRPWDRSNPGTYATFIFRYRTRRTSPSLNSNRQYR